MTVSVNKTLSAQEPSTSVFMVKVERGPGKMCFLWQYLFHLLLSFKIISYTIKTPIINSEYLSQIARDFTDTTKSFLACQEIQWNGKYWRPTMKFKPSCNDTHTTAQPIMACWKVECIEINLKVRVHVSQLQNLADLDHIKKGKNHMVQTQNIAITTSSIWIQENANSHERM